MGFFGFLPKIERCCWCTRNLKFATICIICWSWFVAVHEIAMTFNPSCKDQYLGDGLGKVLRIYKWILFFINCAVLVSAFAFLLGMFMFKPITGDIFVICGLVVAIFSLFYAILVLVRMFAASCPFNLNDVVLFLVYCGMWCYYLLIVNTYRETLALNTPERVV